MLDSEDVVLGIIEAAGGTVKGRTYLQKVAYFVGEILKQRLGFRPHYYGPYSPVVTAERERQVALGRLSEEVTHLGGSGAAPGDFERMLYAYALTGPGRQYLKAIKGGREDAFAKLAEVVKAIRETRPEPDYRQLSLAAKLHYILKEADGPVTLEAANKRACELGWPDMGRMGDPDAAIEVLKRLKLLGR